MKKWLTIIVIFTFSSGIIRADEGKYNICYTKGFFSGEGDRFLYGLASQIAGDKGLMDDPACIDAHKSGFSFGAKFAVTGKYSTEQEKAILESASGFRKRVNNAVIRLIE